MDGWMGFFPFLTYFFLTTVAKNQERFGTIGATLLYVCRMSMWLLSQRVLFIQKGEGAFVFCVRVAAVIASR